MMTPELREKLIRIANHNGLTEATELCQEECGELVQAISKCRRMAKRGTLEQRFAARMELQSEIADVIITALQVSYLTNSDAGVRRAVYEKINRTIEREGICDG